MRPLRFRGGHALHAMDAAFVFQLGIDFVALNGGDDFFHAPLRGRRAFHDFDFPALGFGVAGIHAEKIAGENAGLVAAGAGADFDDDVFVVVGILGDKQQLQFALDLLLAGGELAFLFLGHVAHVGVFGLDDHLARAGEVLFDLLELAVLVDDLFEFGVLFGELLEARGIGDDFGGGQVPGSSAGSGCRAGRVFRRE